MAQRFLPGWCLIFRVLLISCTSADNYNINLQPKQLINAENLGRSFRGNGSHSDHFKLLVRDGNFLLVGARNTVYNLSMDTLSVQKVVEWPATSLDMELCLKKSKSKDDCHNYIRVLVKQRDGKILICGTNAFQPLCRQYIVNDDLSLQIQREFSGYAISPYDPSHNSTAHYVADSDELYSGSVSDFTGSDSLIYRKSLSGPNPEMRTSRNDLKCLNDPNFVSSFSDEKNVYFWFRETAAEFTDHGRQIYGRVARVCKKDVGSPSGSRHRHPSLGTWTTFVKARLNCSLPGQIPFYFNELQATTNVIFGRFGGMDASLVYAIFSTPYNGIQASAICAFSMEHIRRVFERGAFKHQPDSNSLWLPLVKSTAPGKRPGSCDTSAITDDMINFIHKNPLMHDAVPNFFSRPLFVDTNFKSQMTQIAVHKVRAVDGLLYDVLFVGTSDGRVLKLVVNDAQNGGDPRTLTSLVDSVRVFANHAAVRNLLVYDSSDAVLPQQLKTDAGASTDQTPPSGTRNRRSATTGDVPQNRDDGRRDGSGGFSTFTDAVRGSQTKLVVVSQDEVKTVPVQYCSNKPTCGSCVRLQDPHCAWDLASGRCIGVTDGMWPNDRKLVQNIGTGQPTNCPLGEFDAEFYSVNDFYAPSTSQNDPNVASLVYSAESMALAVVLTMTCALMVGFVVGQRSSSCRRRRPDDRCLTKNRSPLNVDELLDDDYEAPPSYKTRASDFYASTLHALHQANSTSNKFTLSDCCYGTTAPKKDGVNNVADVSVVNCYKTVTSPNHSLNNAAVEKNLLPPPLLLNNGTLPKDYKVKKVYL